MAEELGWFERGTHNAEDVGSIPTSATDNDAGSNVQWTFERVRYNLSADAEIQQK